jgi:hypothetical protein
MKWRPGILAAFCAAVWWSAAFSQSNILGSGVYGDIKVAAAGYTGPGDVISGAKAFYSCARAYNAAYATANGNMCIIADAGTGAITCTMKAAATGFADLTSSLCTGGTLTVGAFCTAHTSCVVTQMYDQSGALACTGGAAACPIAQATLASMPALTFSALNGLPCVTFASQVLTASVSLTVAQPLTMTVVMKRTSVGVANIFGDTGGAITVFQPNSANQVQLYAGSNTAAVTMTDGAFHGLQVVANGGASASTISVDGTGTAVSTGTNGWAATDVDLGYGTSFGGGAIGPICEAGIWGTAFSSGNQTTMFNNMNGSSGYNGGL